MFIILGRINGELFNSNLPFNDLFQKFSKDVTANNNAQTSKVGILNLFEI
jgi:hypothetical protein